MLSNGNGRGERPLGFRWVVAGIAVLVISAACGASDSASVFFVEPADGATVTNPVRVAMGVEGFIIEPASEGVGEGRGHFHIMIDAPCVEPRLTVGADERHLHFGKAQTETNLELTAGTHTLCLQAADGSHTALDIVDRITITVEE